MGDVVRVIVAAISLCAITACTKKHHHKLFIAMMIAGISN